MAITEAAINEVAGEEGTEALRHRQADNDRVRELDAHFVCRLRSGPNLLKEDTFQPGLQGEQISAIHLKGSGLKLL